MILLLALLFVLVVLFGGLGFALHLLWIAAIIFMIFFALAYLARK